MQMWTKLLTDGVEALRRHKRCQKTVNEWFYVQEVKMQQREAMRAAGMNPDDAAGQAELLCRMVEGMPLSLPAGSAVAGSQDGAFSSSYALINPHFKVEEFAGYCDPCAIYKDVVVEGALTAQRIENVRAYWENTPFVKRLYEVYRTCADYTSEVAFFVEPVTGHTIPDFREIMQNGVVAMQKQAITSGQEYGRAMARSLDAVLILGRRYREMALDQAELFEAIADADSAERMRRMAQTLQRIPAEGAQNLHDAIQMFTLLWQAMVLEQAPNPYAFSVGNLDRILQPYAAGTDFQEAVALVRHLLCFFQVGSRCWAISQNIMVGGRDAAGADLTCFMTQAVLEAFYLSNDPQPALSMKVHAATPEAMYENAGRFFFTPGHSTPSLFNDDSLFPLLAHQGVCPEQHADYAIAGCQEPLIMGKSSVNTTNTWLNLGKVLELVLNDGRSTLTGRKIGPDWKTLGYADAQQVYANAEQAFFRMLESLLPSMQDAGNACTTILGEERPVPLTSSLMDSFSTYRDMRDPRNPGVRYNASGCLIHGLSVVTDSLIALKNALAAWPAETIQQALASNFQGHEQLRGFLQAQPKYANGQGECDALAARIAAEVCNHIAELRNPAGKPYLADWSTPSTHLLYGYWVGATPDGRAARQMLGYGIDPRPEASVSELPERFVSMHKLPYHRMTGGYSSHIGICPVDGAFRLSLQEKARWLRDRIIKPLFRLGEGVAQAPFYVYFNIDTADHLRAVLKEPVKYAPSGCYIMRIHGTFVNFLDLSPAIQEDIIKRLEAGGKAA